ncbi:MAG: hypothetical protein L6Q33_06095 [Bacteriovoracaceae bacterium]|nr:hypothetical protein [Bacteriovoracaceae bacterium]
MKTFNEKVLKISMLLALITSLSMLSLSVSAQDDIEDSTEEEEEILQPQTKTTQPLIIDDEDSSEASEIQYEE